MEPRNRFAVPVDDLATARVDVSEQVQEQAEPRSPESSQWAGPLPHPFGDGATGADADGE